MFFNCIGSLLSLIGAIAFAVAWLMPGHYPPWATFQTQAVACSSLFFFAIGLIVRRRLPAIDGVAITALALAAVPLCQWVFGKIPFFSDAVVPMTLFGLAAVTIAVGKALRNDLADRYLHVVFAAVVAAGAISIALQWMQWLNMPWLGILLVDSPQPLRPFANLAQPNHLATLLVVAMVGVLYMHRTKALRGSVVACLAAWLLSGLVMTQSRTAWVQLALLASYVACWSARDGRRRSVYICIAVYLSFMIVSLAWIPINDALLLTPAKVETGERLQAGSRMEYWPVLGQAVLHRPWVGWGWNQVSVAQHAMAETGPAGYESLASAHNIILDLALQAGIPLTLLAVGAVVWWVRRHMSLTATGTATLGVAVILCHAMTEYPLEQSHFVILLCLLVSAVDTAPPLLTTGVAARTVFGLVLLVFLLLTGRIGQEYLQVESTDREARFALARYGVPSGSVVEAPRVELLDGLREYHRFRFSQAREGMSEAELMWMQKVVHRYPYPPALLRLALAEGLNGRPERSQAELRALCHSNVPVRCDEARVSWSAAQGRYPALPPFPEVVEAPAWWRRWTTPG